AEAQHDGRVALLHDEEAARQPEQRPGHEQHAQADAGAPEGWRLATSPAAGGQARPPAATPAEQAVQPAVEVAPEFVEIGRTVLAVRARSPRFLVPVAAATASPAGIIEREDRSNALPHGIVCLGGSGQRLAPALEHVVLVLTRCHGVMVRAGVAGTAA